jgi:hypothetical protein
MGCWWKKMKKSIGLLVLIFILGLIIIWPAIPTHAFEIKPADIICWRSDALKFAGLNLSVSLLEAIYGEPLLTHADIVIDKYGTVRSSIQGEGVSESTIENRKEQFNMGILLRNGSLTEEQIQAVIDTTNSMEGAYDWGGYNGLIMDYILRFSWMPERRLYTRVFQDDSKYYCSEFTASSFELNVIDVSARDSSLTSPLDLYYYALNENEGWKVIYTWEAETEEATTL